MAVAAKSVENFSLTISATNRTADGSLTKSQNTDKCIPIGYPRVTTADGTPEDIANYQCDLFWSTTNVRAERDDTGGAVAVEVSVVEFDTDTTVEDGTFQIATGATSATATTATTVNTGEVFVVAHCYCRSAEYVWGQHLIRARITAANTLTFDRVETGGTVDGHWYIAKAGSGEFTVEESDFNIDPAIDTDTIATTDEDKTFIVGSWKPGAGHTQSYANDSNTCDVRLTNSTTVTVERKDSEYSIDYHGYVVELQGDENVYRGSITAQGSVAQDDESIGATVNTAGTSAILAGNMGILQGGSFPSTGTGSDVPDAFVTPNLLNSTTIRIEHSTNGGEADNDISWEAIEWIPSGGAPPPRRIFITV